MESALATKYQALFQGTLTQLEQETGKFYRIDMRVFGGTSDSALTIGSFEKRPQKVLVYDINSKYADLDGIYASIEEIKCRILELRNKEKFFETQEIQLNGHKDIIGRCKRCSSYNLDSTNGKVPNFVSNDICQKCGAYLDSKWNDVKVFVNRSIIGISGGGSVSTVSGIGKFRFLIEGETEEGVEAMIENEGIIEDEEVIENDEVSRNTENAQGGVCLLQ